MQTANAWCPMTHLLPDLCLAGIVGRLLRLKLRRLIAL